MKAFVQEYMFGTAGDMFPPPMSDRERVAGDVTELEWKYQKIFDILRVECLKETVALHSPLNEEKFKALALTDSFACSFLLF